MFKQIAQAVNGSPGSSAQGYRPDHGKKGLAADMPILGQTLPQEGRKTVYFNQETRGAQRKEVFRAGLGVAALALFCVLPGSLLDSGHIAAGLGAGITFLLVMAWGSGAQLQEDEKPSQPVKDEANSKR